MSTKFLEALEANAKQQARASSPLSVAGQLRLRLPDIESALASGFTHRQILQQLNRDGIDLTAAYYHRLIPRLRSAARAGGTDSKDQTSAVQLAPEGIEQTRRPLAPPPIHDRTTAAAQSDAKSDNLSITIAAPTNVKPRTILGGKADGPKFKWDPKGAEKFDPNKL